MAVRFPDIPRTVDPAETHNDCYFDHLIACVKNGQAPGELWEPSGVAIDSNNIQIYVVEGDNIARVSIFSETGEFLNTFSHPDMKWPYGIAIHRDNVYVTDIKEHCIFHFKVEAHFRLVARVGSRGSAIGQFNWPVQLTVLPMEIFSSLITTTIASKSLIGISTTSGTYHSTTRHHLVTLS